MHYNNWNEGVGGLGTELNMLNAQVRKNSLNIAQIVQSSPGPGVSHDHFCENLASLLFHSSARERLQFSQNCHTIRTKELICIRVCVFSNYNPSLKSMWVNDRHKGVQKYLL